MIGELVQSGIGTPVAIDCVKSICELKKSCLASNTLLVKTLSEQVHLHQFVTHVRALLPSRSIHMNCWMHAAAMLHWAV